MARRRKDKTAAGNPQQGQNAAATSRTYTTTTGPSYSQRVRDALGKVRDTTPAVYSPGQFVPQRPALPQTMKPEADLKTPGDAWPTVAARKKKGPTGLDALDGRMCKRKPKSSKGNGTGRKFVPWCK